jgi:energy-coupling factor transporter ATP-binding protein EcfA2
MIVSSLTVTYPGAPAAALTKVSFKINAGAWLGITGSNGSGKTSLLYCLGGLIPRHIEAKIKGEINVNGTSGIVFQNPDFSLFNLTVTEEVAFGAAADINQAIRAAGIWRYRNRDPQTLSYGEKQKVCLAGILARNPEIILLDEPTSMLDYRSSLEFYQLLDRLNRRGKTIVTVEHDTSLLWRFAKKTLILEKGRVAAFGSTKKIFSRRRLISSLGLQPI